MTEEVAKQLAQSLAFNVEALPQENMSHVSNAGNVTPLNVKIRVRKKNDSKSQAKRGLIIMPKPGQSDKPSEKMRLASSDHTLLSFNMLMEADPERKRKSRKSFFGSCLGAQTDDDDGPYMPTAIDNKSETRFAKTKLKNINGMETSHLVVVRKKYNNTNFFGKCKPGGCLDPPFGEDRYAYQPAVKRPAPAETPIKLSTPVREEVAANLRNKNEEVDEIPTKETKINSSDDDPVKNIKYKLDDKKSRDETPNIEISKEKHKISRDSAKRKSSNTPSLCSKIENDSIESKYLEPEDTVITYPSHEKEEENDIRKGKKSEKVNRPAENRSITSNEFNTIYFSPPKKEKDSGKDSISSKRGSKLTEKRRMSSIVAELHKPKEFSEQDVTTSIKWKPDIKKDTQPVDKDIISIKRSVADSEEKQKDNASHKSSKTHRSHEIITPRESFTSTFDVPKEAASLLLTPIERAKRNERIEIETKQVKIPPRDSTERSLAKAPKSNLGTKPHLSGIVGTQTVTNSQYEYEEDPTHKTRDVTKDKKSTNHLGRSPITEIDIPPYQNHPESFESDDLSINKTDVPAGILKKTSSQLSKGSGSKKFPGFDNIQKVEPFSKPSTSKQNFVKEITDVEKAKYDNDNNIDDDHIKFSKVEDTIDSFEPQKFNMPDLNLTDTRQIIPKIIQQVEASKDYQASMNKNSEDIYKLPLTQATETQLDNQEAQKLKLKNTTTEIQTKVECFKANPQSETLQDISKIPAYSNNAQDLNPDNFLKNDLHPAYPSHQYDDKVMETYPLQQSVEDIYKTQQPSIKQIQAPPYKHGNDSRTRYDNSQDYNIGFEETDPRFKYEQPRLSHSAHSRYYETNAQIRQEQPILSQSSGNEYENYDSRAKYKQPRLSQLSAIRYEEKGPRIIFQQENTPKGPGVQYQDSDPRTRYGPPKISTSLDIQNIETNPRITFEQPMSSEVAGIRYENSDPRNRFEQARVSQLPDFRYEQTDPGFKYEQSKVSPLPDIRYEKTDPRGKYEQSRVSQSPNIRYEETDPRIKYEQSRISQSPDIRYAETNPRIKYAQSRISQSPNIRYEETDPRIQYEQSRISQSPDIRYEEIDPRIKYEQSRISQSPDIKYEETDPRIKYEQSKVSQSHGSRYNEIFPSNSEYLQSRIPQDLGIDRRMSQGPRFKEQTRMSSFRYDKDYPRRISDNQLKTQETGIQYESMNKRYEEPQNLSIPFDKNLVTDPKMSQAPSVKDHTRMSGIIYDKDDTRRISDNLQITQESEIQYEGMKKRYEQHQNLSIPFDKNLAIDPRLSQAPSFKEQTRMSDFRYEKDDPIRISDNLQITQESDIQYEDKNKRYEQPQGHALKAGGEIPEAIWKSSIVRTQSSEGFKLRDEDSVYLNLAFQKYIHGNKKGIRTLDSTKEYQSSENILTVKDITSIQSKEIEIPIDTYKAIAINIKKSFPLENIDNTAQETLQSSPVLLTVDAVNIKEDISIDVPSSKRRFYSDAKSSLGGKHDISPNQSSPKRYSFKEDGYVSPDKRTEISNLKAPKRSSVNNNRSFSSENRSDPKITSPKRSELMKISRDLFGDGRERFKPTSSEQSSIYTRKSIFYDEENDIESRPSSPKRWSRRSNSFSDRKPKRPKTPSPIRSDRRSDLLGDAKYNGHKTSSLKRNSLSDKRNISSNKETGVKVTKYDSMSDLSTNLPSHIDDRPEQIPKNTGKIGPGKINNEIEKSPIKINTFKSYIDEKARTKHQEIKRFGSLNNLKINKRDETTQVNICSEDQTGYNTKVSRRDPYNKDYESYRENHTNKAVKYSDKREERIDNIGKEIYRTLSFIYENELVPLRLVIKSLKEDIDTLAEQQTLFRERLHGTKKHRPIKKCGCSKRYELIEE